LGPNLPLKSMYVFPKTSIHTLKQDSCRNPTWPSEGNINITSPTI
jgi:hypothetical protein